MYIGNILRAKYILAILAIFTYCNLFAESRTTSIKLYHDQDSDIIIDDYNLYKLNSLIDTSRMAITKIDIAGYTSPEGSAKRNTELALLRGYSIENHLTKDLELADSLISLHYGGTAWQRLEEIANNQNLPYAASIEAIIATEPEAERDHSLKFIEGGEPYKYLSNSIYPLLRYTEVEITYNVKEPYTPPAVVALPPLPAEEEEVIEESKTAEIVEIPEAVDIPEIHAPQPLFALKTNLLFDLATLVNLEVEIPIKNRWSIAAEYIFPWWVKNNHRSDSRRNRTQLLNGNLEGRYWWGDRSSKPILTGWYSGLYTGAGLYDLERHAKGYQGEFFIAAGISCGYAHTINRAENLRLEYSLGLGYLSTNYKYYHAIFCNNDVWHAIEQREGRYSWFGPTRAKISLSWLINCNRNK